MQEEKQVSEMVWKELILLFPTNTLIHALEIIDKKKVIKYLAKPSDRYLFAVEPSTTKHANSKNKFNNKNIIGGNVVAPIIKKTYKCLSNNYCTCQSFTFGVISKKEFKYCKHLLAILIADALGEYEIKIVKDTELSNLLLDEE
ncbi:hypothetical protein ABK040_003957 [Willaertia magna]